MEEFLRDTLFSGEMEDICLYHDKVYLTGRVMVDHNKTSLARTSLNTFHLFGNRKEQYSGFNLQLVLCSCLLPRKIKPKNSEINNFS